MKKNKLFCVIFFLISVRLFAQNFSDIVHISSKYQPAKNLNGIMTLAQETIREVVIIAMDPGSGCVLPSWFDSLFELHLPQYFSESTHGNFIYQPTVLKRDATHAYEMLTVPPQHSHTATNMNYVFQTADVNVNFALYDWNGDGIVEVHFTSIGPGNLGVAYPGGGYSYEYITNDQGNNGFIKLRVNHESRGINRDNYYGVIVHENGHFYFGFNDQEHAGLTTFNHWGLGSFDAMSHILGFYDDQRVFTQPSPYNPTYSAVKGWISPTNITSDLINFTLQDLWCTPKTGQ